ncbi:hypothetical protein E2562_008170 [Oryza meyeriana var. granulata]|uniref:Xylanase inhibitor N-terminal domain-containing protein n=1 Tax=Oryza meyeriana var. granulata TaxID=110450 RepID=A0A6G1CD89_9ORYZ|nr:hypothetical protein E2562_008170 [Oryza meyeriana var. granulata]
MPGLALVFSGGVVVDLDAHGILSGSCLAFAPTRDGKTHGTIGNVQPCSSGRSRFCTTSAAASSASVPAHAS